MTLTALLDAIMVVLGRFVLGSFMGVVMLLVVMGFHARERGVGARTS